MTVMERATEPKPQSLMERREWEEERGKQFFDKTAKAGVMEISCIRCVGRIISVSWTPGGDESELTGRFGRALRLSGPSCSKAGALPPHPQFTSHAGHVCKVMTEADSAARDTNRSACICE